MFCHQIANLCPSTPGLPLLKWHQTPEHRCNADTKGGPWVEMLPDTSARLFLLPPQDMGMLGKGGRSRIPAVNFPFSTIPGNSLQYCIVRNLNEVGYWRGWQSGGLGYFSLWCHTVTLVTALLKYSEYFEVDVAEHSTRACIDTRMGQNPLNGPKFQGCWPSFPLPSLYCLSTIWAPNIDVLCRACCTASEIFRYTNTNAAGERHLYGVLTPCKSLRRLSLGTGMDRYSLAGCHALPFTSNTNTKRYSITKMMMAGFRQNWNVTCGNLLSLMIIYIKKGTYACIYWLSRQKSNKTREKQHMK